MSQSRYSPRVIPWQKDWDDTDVTCLRAALGFAQTPEDAYLISVSSSLKFCLKLFKKKVCFAIPCWVMFPDHV